MYVFLAQIFTILLPFEAGDCLNPIECESEIFETVFDTNVHVEASVSYRRVPEISPLALYVNETIRNEAHELHDAFVQEMSVPQDELWEEDGDERTFRYDLSLVHSSPGLMSFYGSKYQYRGGAHGSVRYITKTFWQQDDTTTTLLIPYTKLSPIVNPDSLFSVDHLWTTDLQKRAINHNTSR